MEAAVALLVHSLGHHWLGWLTGIIVVWLVVTRAVETSEGMAKLLGPLGSRISRNFRQRQLQYRKDVADEAKQLALELVPQVIPSDYGVVKRELSNVIDRVTNLEVENSAMRAFIVMDEEWHFYHELSLAAGTPDNIKIPERLTWMVFFDRWKEGWRPNGHQG
jgi:hypothetical protein